MSKYDVIIIPGGGVREKGELPVWVKRRLHRALELHSGEYIMTLSAGTVHKPMILDETGFPVFESAAGANYLLEKGLDPAHVLSETISYDTIGNAYFARVIHVDPMELRRLLVITSEFHMPRTEAIFRWVFGLDAPIGGYELFFEPASDEGIAEEVLAPRIERERCSLESFLKKKEGIRSMRELHDWLYWHHDVYAAALRPKLAAGEVLASY